MSVHAYHPETGHNLIVDDAQMDHMRLSGWVERAEWDAQQAAQAAAEAQAEAAQAAPKAAKST